MSDAALARVLAYLAPEDSLPATPADLVLGFGHFDLGIPQRCAELVRAGHGRALAFTGGVGAGSGRFTQPEAEVFHAELNRLAPELAPRVVLTETRSTNTGENVRYTTEALRALGPELTPGAGLRSVILVATPCRMRRVVATARLYWPTLALYAAPPPSTMAGQVALYRSEQQELVPQLVGEMERLVNYPAKGFSASVEIPADVLAAARELGAKV